MLTAWDKTKETVLALPDFEGGAGLGPLRERARQGELLCPTCQQLLWLRAGEILVPHFAHRRLSDCPHGRVSESILAARRLIYRFFQERIERGKLPADIQLEPVLPELSRGMRVDLMLRRQVKPWVAVILLESSLKPEMRERLPVGIEQRKWLFRPVFLTSRLKRQEDSEGFFLLEPTQREFRLISPYDLRTPEHWSGAGTLHFVDAGAAQWTTLRGASLAHEPQVFRAGCVRTSPVEQLLWSETHSEWAHPGEAEALKSFKEAKAAEHRRRLAAARLSLVSARSPSRKEKELAAPPDPSRPLESSLQEIGGPSAKERVGMNPLSPPPLPIETKEPEPLPAWLREGLICVGCGKRTQDWQNADPSKDRCVCRACFHSGIRLPS